jgi:hypothetical protein
LILFIYSFYSIKKIRKHILFFFSKFFCCIVYFFFRDLIGISRKSVFVYFKTWIMSVAILLTTFPVLIMVLFNA